MELEKLSEMGLEQRWVRVLGTSLVMELEKWRATRLEEKWVMGVKLKGVKGVLHDENDLEYCLVGNC